MADCGLCGYSESDRKIWWSFTQAPDVWPPPPNLDSPHNTENRKAYAKGVYKCTNVIQFNVALFSIVIVLLRVVMPLCLLAWVKRGLRWL